MAAASSVGETSVVRVGGGGGVSTPHVSELRTFSDCCSHTCFGFSFEIAISLAPRELIAQLTTHCGWRVAFQWEGDKTLLCPPGGRAVKERDKPAQPGCDGGMGDACPSGPPRGVSEGGEGGGEGALSRQTAVSEGSARDPGLGWGRGCCRARCPGGARGKRKPLNRQV